MILYRVCSTVKLSKAYYYYQNIVPGYKHHMHMFACFSYVIVEPLYEEPQK